MGRGGKWPSTRRDELMVCLGWKARHADAGPVRRTVLSIKCWVSSSRYQLKLARSSKMKISGCVPIHTISFSKSILQSSANRVIDYSKLDLIIHLWIIFSSIPSVNRRFFLSFFFFRTHTAWKKHWRCPSSCQLLGVGYSKVWAPLFPPTELYAYQDSLGLFPYLLMPVAPINNN